MVTLKFMDLIIVGGDCADLTAALYAARAEHKLLVFTGELQDSGGLLTKTSVVKNFPGHLQMQGPDLMETLEKTSQECRCHSDTKKSDTS